MAFFSSVERTAAEAFAAKSYDEAADILARKSAGDPDNFDILLSWANALSHGGRTEEAARIVEHAAALLNRIQVPLSSLQTLLQLAGANSDMATRQRITTHLAELHPDDYGLGLSVLAMAPQYRDPEWVRKLSVVGERILADPASTTQTLDLLCQLASGAENAALVHASAGRLVTVMPEEERHLLNWLRSAVTLGPDMDPAPIVTAAARYDIASASTPQLLEFARVCETTGRLEAALEAYRLVMRHQATRGQAAKAMFRLILVLQGHTGLRAFVDELAEHFPGDDQVTQVRIAVLSELGEHEAASALTGELGDDLRDKPASQVYRALALIDDDEAAAAAIFKKIWQRGDPTPEIERCLQRALVQLLHQGRDAEAFLHKVGFSAPYAATQLALGRLLVAAEGSPDLRNDVLTLVGGPWRARAGSVLLSILQRDAAKDGDKPLLERIAYASALAHGQMQPDDASGSCLALGMLRNAAMSAEQNQEAILSLARLDSRMKVKAGRDWTRPEWTLDRQESLDLWRRLAELTPDDAIIQREYRSARRAATPAILFAGMPRAASVFIYQALVQGLGKTGVGAVMAGAFPDFTLCQEGFQRMVNLRATSHTHLGPTEFNLREIGQRYQLDRMYVHIRDPRQALLSWHDFLPGVLTSLDPTQAFHYKLPSEYLDWSSDKQLDWLVDNWLPVLTDWIVGWARAPELDYFKTEILFTTFEEMVADQTTFFNRILDFYDIDRDLFTPPQAKRGVANYRQGDTHTWRNILTPSQKKRAAEVVPAWLIERFNWPAS